MNLQNHWFKDSGINISQAFIRSYFELKLWVEDSILTSILMHIGQLGKLSCWKVVKIDHLSFFCYHIKYYSWRNILIYCVKMFTPDPTYGVLQLKLNIGYWSAPDQVKYWILECSRSSEIFDTGVLQIKLNIWYWSAQDQRKFFKLECGRLDLFKYIKCST